jgi:hypothetical protein
MAESDKNLHGVKNVSSRAGKIYKHGARKFAIG